MDGLEDQAELEANELVQQIESIFRSVEQEDEDTAAVDVADEDDGNEEHVITIRHSSRDSIVVRVCDTLVRRMTATTTTETLTNNTAKKPRNIITIKRMIFRSGISLNGLQKVRELLHTMHDLQSNNTNRNTTNNNNSNINNNKEQSDPNFSFRLSIDEMEFVCLQGPLIVGEVIKACRTSRMIRRLILRNYRNPPRQNALATRAFPQQFAMLANLNPIELNPDQTDVVRAVATSCFHPLRGALHLPQNTNAETAGGEGYGIHQEQTTVRGNDNDNKDISSVVNIDECLEYLELDNYPIGSKGIQVFAHLMTQKQCRTTVQCLHTLRLLDCDLRSDSALFLGQILRSPNTCNMRVLDLSYNRHLFIGSPLTREMFSKNLIRRGLVHNITLLELHMETMRGNISQQRPKQEPQQQSPRTPSSTTSTTTAMTRTTVTNRHTANRYRRNCWHDVSPILVSASAESETTIKNHKKIGQQIDMNRFLYRIGVHVPIQGRVNLTNQTKRCTDGTKIIKVGSATTTCPSKDGPKKSGRHPKQDRCPLQQQTNRFTAIPSSPSSTPLVSSIASTNMWCHCFAKVSNKPSALYLLLQSHICHTGGQAFTYYHTARSREK